MFHLGCQIKILVFWGIFSIKKSKKTKWQPCPCVPWKLEQTAESHSVMSFDMHCMSTQSLFWEASMLGHGAGIGYTGPIDDFSLVTAPHFTLCIAKYPKVRPHRGCSSQSAEPQFPRTITAAAVMVV